MDGRRFDALTRALAAPSRRALLKAMAGAIVAMRPRRVGAELACPADVPCVGCAFDPLANTLDCSGACAEPADGAGLCAVAAVDRDLGLLDAHLRADGFEATEGAGAFDIRTDGGATAVMAVLALPMARAGRPEERAVVALVRGAGERRYAAALLQVGAETVAVLTIDAAGSAVEHRPAAAPVAGARLAGPVLAMAQVGPNPCARCGWCDIVCSVPAEVLEFVACEYVVLQFCGPSAAGGPPAAGACVAVVSIVCALGVGLGCQAACGEVTACADCDAGCQSRDSADCGRCIDDCASRQPGTVCCQGQCLDPALFAREDASNCGACGLACALGQQCCAGACVAADHLEHCGACGNVCSPGQACSSGRDNDFFALQCVRCVADYECAPCERCDVETGTCEDICGGGCDVCDRGRGTCRSTCGPCAFCDARGACQPLDHPICRGSADDEPTPTATDICPEGQERCPGYLYDCCPDGEYCCPGLAWCCPDGCRCCGVQWCCCGGTQCSPDYLTACV